MRCCCCGCRLGILEAHLAFHHELVTMMRIVHSSMRMLAMSGMQHSRARTTSTGIGQAPRIHAALKCTTTHGGSKRYQYPDCCDKSAPGRTLFCAAHGGGKRCQSRGWQQACAGIDMLCLVNQNVQKQNVRLSAIMSTTTPFHFQWIYLLHISTVVPPVALLNSEVKHTFKHQYI
jgi:hypothetical protein